MSKLFLSVRITKSFFNPNEIEKIKKEIESCNNKSEFVRKAIKNYLNITDDKQIVNKINIQEFNELKILIKKNQLLLKELKENNNNSYNNINYQNVYEGDEQQRRTDQILNLLNQF